MNDFLKKIRQPVKRQGAENSLLIFLVSFGGSVLITRIFLTLTNYPVLGLGGFHIAHVLWGGIFLMLASLLTIIFTNRWTYPLSAFMAGIGTGLFIDEIGKFITLKNNYFYQPAAAIIYAFFLLAVFLYVRIRRPGEHDAKTELYHALDSLQEFLDSNLDKEEYNDIVHRLRKISKETSYPELSTLATSILSFLKSEQIKFVPAKLSLVNRLELKLLKFEENLYRTGIFKIILTLIILFLAFESLSNILLLLRIAIYQNYLPQMLQTLFANNVISGNTSLVLFLMRLFLEGFEGILFFIASYFWIFGNERKAISTSVFALLLSLTTIHLLAFYFDQFMAVVGSIGELVVLLAVMRFRALFREHQ